MVEIGEQPQPGYVLLSVKKVEGDSRHPRSLDRIDPQSLQRSALSPDPDDPRFRQQRVLIEALSHSGCP